MELFMHIINYSQEQILGRMHVSVRSQLKNTCLQCKHYLLNVYKCLEINLNTTNTMCRLKYDTFVLHKINQSCYSCLLSIFYY
jgi:hypothetical protein